MFRVRLDDYIGAVMIFPFKTGVEIINQSGGGVCFQKSIEGFIVPIPQTQFINNGKIFSELEIDLAKLFCSSPEITEDFANKFDQLMSYRVETSSIKINRERQSQSCEAWVNVIVRNVWPFDVEGLEEINEGILAWCNSD